MQISRKVRRGFVITIIIVAIAIVFFIVLGQLDKSEGATRASATLEVQSVLEMTETNLSVQLSGEVKAVNVSKGDTVKKGQVLGIIDDEGLQIKRAQAEAGIETIQGQIRSAQANLAGAEAKLTQIQEGARPEEIVQLKSKYDLAEANCQRMKILYQEGAISQVEYESAVSDRDIKKAQYDISVKGVKASELKAVQASVSAAAASIDSLKGQLKNAQYSSAEIELQLAKTKILSPVDGVLNQLNLKEGELVSAGSKAATIVNDIKPWIECNIKETDISKVKTGQEVNIRFGAYKDKNFAGKVVSINKGADFAVKRATNESGSFDIKAYGVKVEVDETDIPLYAGMTVFVTFKSEVEVNESKGI
ncbi:HlyD family efflux transporter periplasmic adaptor subunit [Desulfosporosinus sp.]|uniref:HlyD family secretion protein n=1 Tax=Desulfosporosinus sp. TaxID=157907 RepID=UPI0025BF728F|nr:HlyD family efflux transporter periplasmic adaptor subunit [Desulfosporosinus sp.]MBC2723088.1 HlyD family secretion protein [Desulfosporosinus sp.]MBC2726162.1 HlyD family secretion protein [Desulfosporosinus sp.]